MVAVPVYALHYSESITPIRRLSTLKGGLQRTRQTWIRTLSCLLDWVLVIVWPCASPKKK